MSNLIITNSGLSQVAKELINKRSFDKDKISVIGNALISEEGVVSNLSEDTYLYSNNFNTSTSEEISIKFIGTYNLEASLGAQCAWSISDSTYSNNISLIFYENSINITNLKTMEVLVEIEKTFNIGDYLSVLVTLKNNSYSINFTHNRVTSFYEGTFNNSVQNLSYLTLGNSDFNKSLYWEGSIDLSEFIITSSTTVIYAPSDAPNFSFSKILISDGSVELSDSSTPVLGHVYFFSIEELNRTGNNILLRAQINSDIYLNIDSVGLYIRTATKEILFSSIKGLSIKKGKDLGYELIFKINMNIEVVNTIAFPEIVLTKEEYLKLSEFVELKKIYTNTVIDLERAITRNAYLIGYGREFPQYNVQNDINLWSDNCSNIQQYIKLNNHIYSENKKNVTDFYGFFNYPYFNYTSKNLCNVENSDISVLDGSLTGLKDSINFEDSNGFTLIVRVLMDSIEDKFILGKAQLGEMSPYFSLFIEDNFLKFQLYFSDGNYIELSKHYGEAQYDKLIGHPVNIFIVNEPSTDGSYFNMYVDNEQVYSVLNTNTSYLNYFNYSLVNYKNAQEKVTNYVQKIISFSGSLNKQDIFYINSLLGG